MKLFKKNMFKKISKLFNKVKKIEYCEYITIAKTGKTQDFKGHSFDISYEKSKDKEGSIIVSNSYYSGGANQRYSIDDKQTISSYSIIGFLPIWLQTKLLTIQATMVPDNCNIDIADNNEVWGGGIIELNDNPEIRIYMSEFNIKYTTLKKGVAFNDHFHNINELKQLQMLWRGLRNKLKSTDIEVIANNLNYSSNKGILLLDKNFLK